MLIILSLGLKINSALFLEKYYIKKKKLYKKKIIYKKKKKNLKLIDTIKNFIARTRK